MEKNDHGKPLLQVILSRRIDLINLVIAGVILAFGVGLLSNAVSGFFSSISIVGVLLGAGVIFCSLLLIVWIMFRQRQISYSCTSYFFLNTQKMSATPLLHYPFSSNVANILKAILVESNDLKMVWERELPWEYMKAADNSEEHKQNAAVKSEIRYAAVISGPGNEEKDPSCAPDIPDSQQLLRDIVEYIIINQLSSHLASYFSEYKEEDKHTYRYSRKEIPELLLENRVLSLLSTPLEERAIFSHVNDIGVLHESGHYISAIYSSDGSVFKEFTLILPKGTRITRPGKNRLQINNKRLAISISVGKLLPSIPLPQEYTYLEDFSGSRIPHGFMKAIFGSNESDLVPVQVPITLTYRVKPFSLIRKGGWEYHQWVDSFVNRIEKHFSFTAFIEKIHWHLLYHFSEIFNGERKEPPRIHQRPIGSTNNEKE